LDNQANVTITGDTTLSGLSEGSHSLIVYANDTVGNTGTSETIHFSINTQQEPSPIKFFLQKTIWILAVVTIAGFGVALLVYFTRVKKTTEKTNNVSRIFLEDYSTFIYG